MRVILRAQYGATVGGVGAAAAVTAAGAPELIPLAVPIGAAGGQFAEEKIKGMVKKDDPLTKCEDLTNLRYLWDEEMVRLQADVNASRYEDAERRGTYLIDLDSRILRSVNCHEANKAQSIVQAISR